MSTPSQDQGELPPRAYVALVGGVLAVSTGAIFTRFAQQEAPSLSIAAYRMAVAFVLVLVPTWIYRRSELHSLTYRELALAATSGLLLAIHFATWIYSLELTSVAISVVLVNTAPLWAGLLTPLVAREQLTIATIVGVVISVAGAATIAWGLPRDGHSSNDLLGGLWATVGAVGLAGYLLLGRNLRSRLSLGVYVTMCYGTAAGFLWMAAIGTRQQITGFSPPTWFYLVGLAVVSQVLGHTLNNWALRFFSAAMIAVALVGEPIVSSLLAYLLFDETLTALQFVGAAMILVGIYFAARAERL